MTIDQVDQEEVDEDTDDGSCSSDSDSDNPPSPPATRNRPPNKHRATASKTSKKKDKSKRKAQSNTSSSSVKHQRKSSARPLTNKTNQTMAKHGTRNATLSNDNAALKRQLAAMQARLDAQHQENENLRAAAARSPPTPPTNGTNGGSALAATNGVALATNQVGGFAPDATNGATVATNQVGGFAPSATNGAAVAPNEIAAVPPDPSIMAQMKADSAKQHAKINRKTGGNQSDMKSHIHNAIKDLGGFKVMKFITNKFGKKKFAELVINLMKLDGFTGNGDKAVAAREQWVATYAPLCSTKLNEHRNYVQTRIKNVCDAYMALPTNVNGDMPSLELLRKCINRTIDLNKEEEKSFFWWFWTKLLPSAVGNATDWHEDIAYYATILEAAPPNKPNHKYVTPSTEAFAYLAIDNNYAKWKRMREIKDTHGHTDKKYYVRLTKDGKDRKEELVSPICPIVSACVHFIVPCWLKISPFCIS